MGETHGRRSLPTAGREMKNRGEKGGTRATPGWRMSPPACVSCAARWYTGTQRTSVASSWLHACNGRSQRRAPRQECGRCKEPSTSPNLFGATHTVSHVHERARRHPSPFLPHPAPPGPPSVITPFHHIHRLDLVSFLSSTPIILRPALDALPSQKAVTRAHTAGKDPLGSSSSPHTPHHHHRHYCKRLSRPTLRVC